MSSSFPAEKVEALITREELQEKLDQSMAEVLGVVNAMNDDGSTTKAKGHSPSHGHDNKRFKMEHQGSSTAINHKEWMSTYTMVYKACTQKKEDNLSEFTYQYYGQKYALLLPEIKLRQPLDSPWARSLLSQLCSRWLKHRVLADSMRRCFMYVERYYVRHNMLPDLMMVADNLFIQGFITPSLPLLTIDIQALVGDSSDDANKLLHLASTSGILEVLKTEAVKSTHPSMSSLAPNLDLLLEKASQMISA